MLRTKVLTGSGFNLTKRAPSWTGTNSGFFFGSPRRAKRADASNPAAQRAKRASCGRGLGASPQWGPGAELLARGLGG